MSAPVVESYLTQIPHRKPIQAGASHQPYANQSSPAPYGGQIPSQQQSSYAATMASYAPAGETSTRRTLSNATTSTSSTSSSAPKNSGSIRRSSSGRSSARATSYVALLRKQKATVWCERSQAEDPRILQAQRLAKERATREVSGYLPQASSGLVGRVTPTGGSGSFTTGVARKIRHHGVPKTNIFNSGNLAGAGVPTRMIASEVEDDETGSLNEKEWEKDGWGYNSAGVDAAGRPLYHARTGSGRSSQGSGRRPLATNPNIRMSTASSTPSSHHSRSPSESTRNLVQDHPEADYSQEDRTKTGSSMSSGEREDGFGGLGTMPAREKKRQPSADELRRRGSVDDRSMTMSGAVRLFVANPDLSD